MAKVTYLEHVSDSNIRFVIRFLLPLTMISFVGCDGTENSLLTARPTPPDAIQTEKTSEPAIERKQKNSTDTSLDHLRKWIGKYPANPDQKKPRNFFDEPTVKSLLTGIVGQKEFQNVLEHFQESFGDDLIYETKGFLVIQGITKRENTQLLDYGMIAVNLKTRETHIFLVDSQKLTSFNNTKGDGTLPIEIKEKILVYTDSYESPIVGTIKQKPPGFGCYAVRREDWDKWDYTPEKRPYVFIVTDEGEGLMNIEGQDVLLKYVDSVEYKSENGKKRYDWIYGNKNIRAMFELSVTGTENEGKHLFYDGKATVSTYAKTQTVQIKATCYD